MLSVRNAIISAIAILVLSISAMCIGFLLPPDSDGMASDSYGTRSYGFRGLLEVFQELGVNSQRSLAAPTANISTNGTLLLLRPHAQLVANEPRYLEDLLDWVEQGGRVVVAPHRSSWTMQQLAFNEESITILDILGLSEVSLTSWDDDDFGFAQNYNINRKASFEDLTEAWRASRAKPPPPVMVKVECKGSLNRLSEDVSKIAFPKADAPTAIELGECEPDGKISWTSGGEERLLAATFSRGKGNIIVVANPLIFANRFLARADNSVLAASLIADDRTEIVFDEFYHGLGVRGNPFFLLTQPAFATIAFSLLLVVGLTTWRSAIFLGPPLADPQRDRRDIGEYVDAMAWFFSRGVGSRRFVLREVRDGVLRSLCEELHLPMETRDAGRIAGVLRRHSIVRAELLLESDQIAHALISQPSDPRYVDSTRAMKRMIDCL